MASTDGIGSNVATNKGPVVPSTGSSIPGGCGVGWVAEDGFVFSARTCLALLPYLTNEQVQTELNHLQAFDSSTLPRLRATTIEGKRDILHKNLTKTLCHEVDSIANNYNLLIKSISCTIGDAQRHLEDTTAQLTTPLATSSEDSSPAVVGNIVLPEPVRLLNDIHFNDIMVEQILESFEFKQKQSGYRETLYFGDLGYSYGSVEHAPANFPDSPIIDSIYAKLNSVDPDFTKDKYTCLITHYPGGNSYIPPHHDDEKSIKPGSNIFTVSFGETRNLRLTNIKGAINQHNLDLEHGSVYVMSHESQTVWQHEITRDSSKTGSRVSFTFRHIVEPPAADSSSIPAVHRPSTPVSEQSPARRILFLTDSIHSRTPTFLFDNNVKNHVVVKKVNYQLTDVFNFHDEFAYTDQVIVSCGINDLSRYNHTANSLADIVCAKLKHFCARYPRTKFIFNSILLTTGSNCHWLNPEVRLFNKYVFELSSVTPNLCYFDSDNLVKEAKVSQVYVPVSKGGNNTHITLEVKKLIVRELVSCVGMLAGCHGDRFRNCRWLRNVTTRGSWAG